MYVDPHIYMDHPCDHTNDALLPAVPLEEPVRVEASTSASPKIQAPSLPRDTPTFQAPSHSQHEDYLPQLTEEQKEDLMRIHTELTSQENPTNEVTSFEFEEPRDQTDVHNAIFKEPHDKAVVSYNSIWGESQGESDDSKNISEPADGKSISKSEESDQEEWTPHGKSKQARPIAKSNVDSIERQGEFVQEEWTPHWKSKQARSIAKSNVDSIEQQRESDQEEWKPHGKSKQARPIAKSNVDSIELQGESDQEEWKPHGKSKQARSKSNVKGKYTKRNSAKTQDSEAS